MVYHVTFQANLRIMPREKLFREAALANLSISAVGPASLAILMHPDTSCLSISSFDTFAAGLGYLIYDRKAKKDKQIGRSGDNHWQLARGSFAIMLVFTDNL